MIEWLGGFASIEACLPCWQRGHHPSIVEENSHGFPMSEWGKTGCPGGVHPVAVVVDPVEDQAIAMGGPNEGIPIEWRPLACEVTW